MKRIFVYLPLAFLALYTSCKNPSQKEEDVLKDADTTTTGKMNEQAEFQFDLTVSNIPAPYALMDNISEAGIGFDKNLINPLSGADHFTSLQQKALNFGMYNIDLGYLAVYNQNQDVINYFVQTRKMAKDLGAGPFFDEISGNVQLDKSLGNKEQMLSLLDKAYSASDKYLRSNQRLVAASLMLVGGWIESQHIALESLKGKERSKKTEALYNKIFEQRPHLGNIVKLLEFLKEEKEVEPVFNKMKEVEPLYKELSKSEDLNSKKINEMAEKIGSVRQEFMK